MDRAEGGHCDFLCLFSEHLLLHCGNFFMFNDLGRNNSYLNRLHEQKNNI